MRLEDFQLQINIKEKTLVKFGASWCGPCKMADKVLAKVVEDGYDCVMSIDVEDNPKLGVKYMVRTLPTYIIFYDGEEVERFTGRKTKQELINKLNK
tara:strand:- start:638 stop:928 length:291 start_codon:yes stop_codon:yes gene_type:complete